MRPAVILLSGLVLALTTDHLGVAACGVALMGVAAYLLHRDPATWEG